MLGNLAPRARAMPPPRRQGHCHDAKVTPFGQNQPGISFIQPCFREPVWKICCRVFRARCGTKWRCAEPGSLQQTSRRPRLSSATFHAALRPRNDRV